MTDTAYPQLWWCEIEEGDALPRVSLDITLKRLIVNAAASWDSFPGHFDREYARGNGHPDVFANTSLLLALADRIITDWCGPKTRIVRRKLTLVRPVHPGVQLSGEGLVTARRLEGNRHLVDVEVELCTDSVRCAYAVATIDVPVGPGLSVPTPVPTIEK